MDVLIMSIMSGTFCWDMHRQRFSRPLGATSHRWHSLWRQFARMDRHGVRA
jgi:hypothetical protein